MIEYSEERYSPPYNYEQMLKAGYPKEKADELLKDPVHGWRMKTGIELMHREPSKSELKRTWANWQLMTPEMKRTSDKKSISLFGCTNEVMYRFLLPQYKVENPDKGIVKYPTAKEISAINATLKITDNKTVLIATTNPGKLAELSQIFANTDYKIITPKDIKGGIPDVVENQTTFEGNAKKKAKAIALATGYMCVADDSGLEVEALNGAPGVHSARYAKGEAHNSPAHYQLLLENLKGKSNRKAKFVTALCLADKYGIIETVRGELNGVIIDEPRGENGISYDVVFLPNGSKKTLAEMTPEEKNRCSHRHLAAIQMMKVISKVQASTESSTIKSISFPEEEIPTISKQSRIITTRVSANFERFQVNDLVKTPWNQIYKVNKRLVIDDIKKHPYYKELTEGQIEFLSRYDKIAVLELIRQESATESYVDVKATDISDVYRPYFDRYMYHGSSHKYDTLIPQVSNNRTTSTTKPVTFFTPFKGFAGIFCINQNTDLLNVFGDTYDTNTIFVRPKRLPKTNENGDFYLEQFKDVVRKVEYIHNVKEFSGKFTKVFTGYIHCVDTDRLIRDGLKEHVFHGMPEYWSFKPEHVDKVEKVDIVATFEYDASYAAKKGNAKLISASESTEALSSKVWTEKDINSIVDLKRFYNDSNYGTVLNGRRYYEDTLTGHIIDKTHILTVEEQIRYKIGMCYDTVGCSVYFLSKWGIPFKAFLQTTRKEYDTENGIWDDPTHTFLIYNENGTWKWLEGSWGTYMNNNLSNTSAEALVKEIGHLLYVKKKTPCYIKHLTKYPKLGQSIHTFYKEMMTGKTVAVSTEAIIPKIAKNIKNNTVYHCSPKKHDILKGSATGTWSGEQGNVFVTPLKGIAACFIINKTDILTALEKQLGKRVTKCNFGYDVWNWSNDKLQDIPKHVTVMMNIRGFKPFKGQSTGYLYTIDFSQYKDKCHMFNKNANSDVEFLIEGDVKPMKVEQITVNWVCVSSEEEIKRKGEGSVEGFKDWFKTDQYSSYSWSKFKPIYLKKVSNILSSKDVQSILSKPTHMTYTWNDYKDLIVYAKKYLDTIKKLPNSNSTPIDKFTNIAIALGKSLPKLPRPQYRVVSIKESGILNTKLVCACVDEGNRIAKELHNATVVYSGEYDKILKQAFEIHPSGATYLCDDISDLDRKLHKFCMSSEGSAEVIITPIHTTVVITPDYVVDVPRGKTIETKDGQKLYCRPEDGTIEYMTGSVESLIPSMEAVSTTSYYRISYGKTGIYQALKDHLTKDEWGKFLGSDEAKWLPKPTCEYKKGYKSYFTEAGYKKFLLKTDKYIKKYLKDDKIVIAKYDDISHMNIVYRDQYQIVTNGKEEPTRTVVSNENLKFSNEYEPPYNAEQMLQAGYSKEIVEKLSKDPVHSWRMKTGIELIHIEPSKTELMRIWHNWNLMPIGMKNKSEAKAKELFHCTNAVLYAFLLPQYTSETPDHKSLRYPTAAEIKAIESNPEKMKQTLFASSESLESIPSQYSHLVFENTPIKKKIYSICKPYYPDEGSHGYNHIKEVLATAYVLKGKKDLTDQEYTAILFHDVGRRDEDESKGRSHNIISEKIAREKLPKLKFFTDTELDQIYQAILYHSNSWRKEHGITDADLTSLSELVANADKGFPQTTYYEICLRPTLWILEGNDVTAHPDKMKRLNNYSTIDDIAQGVLESLDSYSKKRFDPTDTSLHARVFAKEKKLQIEMRNKITITVIKDVVKQIMKDYGYTKVSTEAFVPFIRSGIFRTITNRAKPFYNAVGSNSWQHIQQVLTQTTKFVKYVEKRDLLPKEYAAVLFHDSSVKSDPTKEHHAKKGAEIAKHELADLFNKDELNEIYTAILEHDKQDNPKWKFSSNTSDILASADANPPDVDRILNKSYTWGIKHGLDHKARIDNMLKDSVKIYGSTPEEGGMVWPMHYAKYYKTHIDKMRKDLKSLSAETCEARIMAYRKRHRLTENDIRLPAPSCAALELNANNIEASVESLSSATEILSASTEALPANIKAKRKKIEEYILASMRLLDPHTDINQKYWKNKFASMSDADFDKFMHYLQEKKCNIHMFVPPLKVHLKNAELIEAAHKLGVKLMHRIWMTDNFSGTKYLTPEEYMVLQLPIRRQQQFLDEKMSVPDNDKTIDGLTGQVTGESNKCAITNPEIHILQARNLSASLYEFVNVRGGNINNYAEFKRSLEETGTASLNSLDPNNRTRVAVMGGVLLQSMMFESNLLDM